MATYTLTVDEAPKDQDVQTLAQGLTAHALPYTHVPGFQPLAVFLRDDQGILLGGVWGHVNWNWLSVGLVWLSDTLRGEGRVYVTKSALAISSSVVIGHPSSGTTNCAPEVQRARQGDLHGSGR